MEEKKIRNLNPEEIECRVGSVTDRGATILLYKNARVDQSILDEVFGIYGWQRRHEKIGDELYCIVSIWDEEKQQWVHKEDVGKESDYEKAKGAASDSFKRACFNLGIGRELYSAPVIYLTADKVITGLVIVNQRQETVFTYHTQDKPEPLFTEAEMQELNRELERTGVSIQKLLQRYKITSLEEMDRNIYRRALSGLRRTKSAA